MQMLFEPCFRKHILSHPALQMQDVIKFCFQAAFGAEHLLTDPQKARQFFDQEYASVTAEESAEDQMLGGSYCRVSMAAWKAHGKDPRLLFDLFYASASQPLPSSEEDFRRKLFRAVEILKEYPRFFPKDFGQRELEEYLSGPIQPVHHSAIYRSLYKPAYRVVQIRFLEEFNIGTDVMKTS